jgi:hypothetical protein
MATLAVMVDGLATVKQKLKDAQNKLFMQQEELMEDIVHYSDQVARWEKRITREMLDRRISVQKGKERKGRVQ